MNQNENKKILKCRKGFTLIEIVVVLAVITLIFGIGLGSIISTQRQVFFLSTYETVLQTVRDTRSMALAGKAITDYTDYDQDGSKTDLVTPANYGVSFDLASRTVTVFADIHKGTSSGSLQLEGRYNPPNPFAFSTYVTAGTCNDVCDVALSQYKLDSRFMLVSNMFKMSVNRVDVFFSPIFGDFSVKTSPVDTPFTEKFLIFGVADPAKAMNKCSKIQPVAGVPELALDTECKNP